MSADSEDGRIGRRLRRIAAIVGVVLLVAGATACSSSSSHDGATANSGSSQTPEQRAQELIAQAKVQLGADFDDGQIDCMAGYAVAHPVLLEDGAGTDATAPETAAQSQVLMAMVLGCVPRPQFISYVVSSLVQPDSGDPALTAADASCVSNGLSNLTDAQLTAMMSDPTIQATLASAIAPCVLGSATTTSAT